MSARSDFVEELDRLNRTCPDCGEETARELTARDTLRYTCPCGFAGESLRIPPAGSSQPAPQAERWSMKHQPTTTKTFTPDQVAKLAVERGADRFFESRIRDMADSAYTVTGRQHGDRQVAPFVAVRVAKGWPVRGSITLTREDGARFVLRMTADRFVIEHRTTKAEAEAARGAGFAFAVWSTDRDVTFHRTLSDARAASSGARTWTSIEELIGAL